MFTKLILKENGNVCRADNGEVIGNRTDYITFSFMTFDKKLIHPKYGYFSEDGSFNELCKGISCSHECLCKRKPDCRYIPKGDLEVGFYYETNN